LLANLIAIGAGTIWNYVVNSRLTWNLTHLAAHLPHHHHEHVEHIEKAAVGAPD
jgi:hypothetical protein